MGASSSITERSDPKKNTCFFVEEKDDGGGPQGSTSTTSSTTNPANTHTILGLEECNVFFEVTIPSYDPSPGRECNYYEFVSEGWQIVDDAPEDFRTIGI